MEQKEWCSQRWVLCESSRAYKVLSLWYKSEELCSWWSRVSLNGVDRGGHYSTASLQNDRSGGARLNNKRLNAVIDYIGFRLPEWCAEGWVVV